MNNGQRTVTTLLAVVAVMLGLNLIVRGSPPAVAQEPEIGIFPEPPPMEPTVVGGTAYENQFGGHRVWRFWSDGTVDMSAFSIASGASCSVQESCGPVLMIPGI